MGRNRNSQPGRKTGRELPSSPFSDSPLIPPPTPKSQLSISFSSAPASSPLLFTPHLPPLPCHRPPTTLISLTPLPLFHNLACGGSRCAAAVVKSIAHLIHSAALAPSGSGFVDCFSRKECEQVASDDKSWRSREHARSMHAGRERGDRPEGRRGQQEEGGGEADEAEEGEAGEDDVVFECGPLCSCALQQHRIASHPGPHTATSTVETAEAAPAAPAAAEAVEGGATITPACPTCPNRSSQRGVQWNLAVVWSGSKGWTLVAQESIPRGAFICQYAGEVVSAGEASARQALYDAAGLHIDPSRMGSLGRFMSHECGGGNVARVVVRQAGCLLPAVGLVARREVRQGEELTFSYGGVGEGEGEDGDGDGKREVEGGEGGSVGGDDGEGGRVEGEEDGREECWKSGWEQQQQQQRRLVKRSKCCCGSVRCSGYLPFDML
ncbi:unnamed protein product [Closterium sp. NIES-65]|nr:unnamed protein product [Closterium sp. NIES-65]